MSRALSLAALQPILEQLPLSDCDGAGEARTCLSATQEAFLESVRNLGFSSARFNHAVVKPNHCDETPAHLVDAAHLSLSVNFGNFPPTWVQQYEGERLYDVDPIFLELGKKAVRSWITYGTWQEIFDRYLETPPVPDAEKERYRRRCRAVLTRAADHGLASGIYLLHREDRRTSLTSLASVETPQALAERFDHPENWKLLLTLVLLTNTTIERSRGCRDCTRSLRIMPGLREVALSRAQREILVAYLDVRNTCARDVAGARGTGVDTVHHHLKAIRAKAEMPGASGHELARFFAQHGLI
ncbi:MAG: autoinducer binding domain-containing protein [Proteobacteria bacterium]|nr:autoinducer binding domain-containing protein [Pseudomonadota bacterium]